MRTLFKTMFGDDAHSSVMFEWTFACLHHHSTCKETKLEEEVFQLKLGIYMNIQLHKEIQ